jgi:hypothetical protein
LISESHGRAWAADLPLLGIVGNGEHEQTLGSLAATPFLRVQESDGRASSRPVHASPAATADAIRHFAADTVQSLATAPRPQPPRQFTFRMSLRQGAKAPLIARAVGAETAGGITLGGST